MPDATIVPRKSTRPMPRPWFVYVGGVILCSKRGTIRRFSTRKAALKAAASPTWHMRGPGPVAQLDRASDFGSEGCGFKSCRDRQNFTKP